ncbi:AAA family ATPase [Proteus terrae]|uniref:AAA family ATPase n=1 Tax=Proteus terrae TaxID=1574161 RepID=UPI0034D6B298
MENKIIIGLVDAALKGDKNISLMAVRKLASKIRTTNTELYKQLIERLEFESLRTVVRRPPVPVDMDSRLSLVKIEDPVVMDIAPIMTPHISALFEQVLMERKYKDELLFEGLQPTKSIIFQGPPGVGKTMSARWLASQLGLPLLVLDLATVMSSFLGKTGSNLRSVLEYATAFPCVLLLDEFDAIAKRRDDDRELGELKRLVTVLLQTIDEWPATSLLLAATNHGELLDPAIWRRFDMEVTFEIPTEPMIKSYLKIYWPDFKGLKVGNLNGMSFSNIDRELRLAKRESILSAISIRKMAGKSNESLNKRLNLTEKKKLAVDLIKQGYSQRDVAKKLGISRPTIKKALDESCDNKDK